MSNDEIRALRLHATIFRRAIEASDRQRLPSSFCRFPRGSCADAAALLARFLHDRGFPIFDLVVGERGMMEHESWTSHAWLEHKGTIVDITADQFPEVEESVLVTTDLSWHGRFRISERRSGDYSRDDPRVVPRLDEAYTEIASHCEKVEHLARYWKTAPSK